MLSFFVSFYLIQTFVKNYVKYNLTVVWKEAKSSLFFMTWLLKLSFKKWTKPVSNKKTEKPNNWTVKFSILIGYQKKIAFFFEITILGNQKAKNVFRTYLKFSRVIYI